MAQLSDIAAYVALVLAFALVYLHVRAMKDRNILLEKLLTLKRDMGDLEQLKLELRNKVNNTLSLLTSEVSRIERIETEQHDAVAVLSKTSSAAEDVKHDLERAMIRMKLNEDTITVVQEQLEALRLRQQGLINAVAKDSFFKLIRTNDAAKRAELLLYLQDAVNEDLLWELEREVSDSAAQSALYTLSHSAELQLVLADKIIKKIDDIDADRNGGDNLSKEAARERELTVQHAWRMVDETPVERESSLLLMERLAALSAKNDYLVLAERVHAKLTKLHTQLGSRINSPRLRKSLLVLCQLQLRHGQKDKLETSYKRIHELYLADPDADKTAIARNIKKLGELYVDHGRLDEAEPMFDMALNLFTQALGPGHPEVINHMRDFARLYGAMSKPDGQYRIYMRLLNLPEIADYDGLVSLVEEIDETSETFMTAGRAPQLPKLYDACIEALEVNKNGARLKKALDLLTKQLDLYQRDANTEPQTLQATCEHSLRVMGALGLSGSAEHRDLAVKLAQIYNSQQQFVKSTELLEKATQEAEAGKAEPADMLQLMITRAKSESGLGRYGDAADSLKGLLELQMDSTALPDAELIELFAELGVVASLLKHYEEAEEYFSKELAAVERLYGEDDPQTVTPLLHQAGLFLNRGAWAKAEPFYRRILKTKQKQLGEDHEDIIPTLIHLAELNRLLKNFDQSEQFYDSSLKVAEKVFGADNARLTDVLEKYAALSDEAGNSEKAAALLQRAERLRSGASAPSQSVPTVA